MGGERPSTSRFSSFPAVSPFPFHLLEPFLFRPRDLRGGRGDPGRRTRRGGSLRNATYPTLEDACRGRGASVHEDGSASASFLEVPPPVSLRSSPNDGSFVPDPFPRDPERDHATERVDALGRRRFRDGAPSGAQVPSEREEKETARIGIPLRDLLHPYRIPARSVGRPADVVLAIDAPTRNEDQAFHASGHRRRTNASVGRETLPRLQSQSDEKEGRNRRASRSKTGGIAVAKGRTSRVRAWKGRGRGTSSRTGPTRGGRRRPSARAKRSEGRGLPVPHGTARASAEREATEKS